MAHGSKHIDILAPRSQFYKGPFGRLFPELPAWSPSGIDDSNLDEYLLGIANNLMVELPGALPSDISESPETIKELEEKFSSNIPAGYTYFGQFVDHDLTFDPTSSLMRKNDPNALRNFRTPRFDLDNIYGTGRSDQPYLYEQDRNVTDHEAKLAIGHAIDDADLPDLPRYKQRALIGDMRNDENSMVSQLQLAFLLAHNNLVDRARIKSPEATTSEVFESAQRTLRWLYQYIVWNDFVPKIIIDDVHKSALMLKKVSGGRKQWICGLDDVFSWKDQPFIPVEFSVAAYRFGHSMVRNSYRTNIKRGLSDFVPIFDNTGQSSPDDLRGFRPITANNSIQWDWFLPMTTSVESAGFPQMARKIDIKLANALAFLFEEEKVDDPKNKLAFLNLKRGLSFDLPSGSDVAKKLCVKPLKLKDNEPDALWYYILREAQGNGGNTMGRVGSIIVGSVFAGILKGDPQSFFSIEPEWTPDRDPLLQTGGLNRDDKGWALASIIRLAGIKADGIGLET